MFKFIHVADIHLDSPLQGLERYEGAPVEEIRGATRKAFISLVNLALEEKVSFVIIAGDMYDGDWKDYNTGLFLLNQLSRLTSKEIPVFIVQGNHDAESKMTRDLKLPIRINMFPSKYPGTFLIEDLGVAIHGQSFTNPAVTEDLASSFPLRSPGFFNIGVLHTSVNGREGHENYAPCKIGTLKSKGYDYWALGHVHTREVLSDDPWIVFSGNIQGRHIKETGHKGCTIVKVDDKSIVSVEHHNLNSIVWSFCDIDVSGEENPYDIVGRVSEKVQEEYTKNNKELTVVRISIHGRCKAHMQLSENPEKWINEIRLSIADYCNNQVWLEKILLKTAIEIDIEEIQNRNDALGDLLHYIEGFENGNGEELLDLIKNELTDLQAKLPSEMIQKLEPIEMKRNLLETLEEVKQLLVSRLISQGAK